MLGSTGDKQASVQAYNWELLSTILHFPMPLVVRFICMCKRNHENTFCMTMPQLFRSRLRQWIVDSGVINLTVHL